MNSRTGKSASKSFDVMKGNLLVYTKSAFKIVLQ